MPTSSSAMTRARPRRQYTCGPTMTFYDASTEREFEMLAIVLGELLELATHHDVPILLVGAAARMC